MSLPNGLRLQVLPDISFLPGCQKHQSAAFIDDRGVLIVWDDDPVDIIERAAKLERELLGLIWQGESACLDVVDEKLGKGGFGSPSISECSSSEMSSDLEAATRAAPKERKTPLLYPIMVCATLALGILCLGTGYRRIAIEIAYDGSFTRCALVVLLPISLWLSLVRIFVRAYLKCKTNQHSVLLSQSGRKRHVHHRAN